MEIRKAVLGDALILTELRMEMRKERESLTEIDYDTFFLNTFSFFETNLQNGRFVSYVCIIDDKIVATSGISYYEVPPTADIFNGKVGYLMNMYTIPEYRNKGIATKLLENIINDAKSKGYDKIVLNTSDMGRNIYLKYGFKYLQNEMVCYL